MSKAHYSNEPWVLPTLTGFGQKESNMVATQRQTAFVTNMINTLLKRHAHKVHEVHGLDETPVQVAAKSTDKAVVAAGKALTKAHKAMKAADAAYQTAIEEHGDAVMGEYAVAEHKAGEKMGKLTADFEFRIRKALGEVELVGPDAAFATLETARNEINKM